MKNVLLIALLALYLALGTGIVCADDGSIIPIDNFDDIAWESCADFKSDSGIYDEELESGGLQFAERFEGQTLTTYGDFDVLSGTPDYPLKLKNGENGQNIYVYSAPITNNPSTYSNVVAGLGHKGLLEPGKPRGDAIGEGSVAVLFPSPQSQFKFDIVDAQGGSATLHTFGADGSLLGTNIITTSTDQTYGFEWTGGTPAIGGFSIHNSDGGGIAYDNICSAADPIDEIIKVTKDYRYADVCFDCPEGTDLGELLPLDAEEAYTLEAVVTKDGTVRSYNPGQYYAVSTVTVLADVDVLTIKDEFCDCEDIGTLSPSHGGGSVAIVQVGFEDPDEAKQILNAKSEAVTVDFDDCTVTVELADVEAGTTILMYVKFGPALKGETWAGPYGCENTMTARATTGGEDPATEEASATASLKLILME
ncbi:MAG: hypothetical protein ACP5E9_08420 [Candidatus Methanospirareceae archaeon]